MSHHDLKRLEQKIADLQSDFDSFVYAVSHDIATPLRHIDGFTHRVLKRANGALDEKSDADLNIVLNSAKKCQQDFDVLKRYSRLTSKFRKSENIDLDAVLSRVLETFAEQIKLSGAKIVADPMGTCDGDVSQLELLFSCLLENALRYRKKESDCEIRLICEEMNQHKRVTMIDNGIGIPQNYLEKIFVIFRRGVDPNEYEGRGCGLAFAKKIVSLHGGEIAVTSDGISGTEVTFLLGNL